MFALCAEMGHLAAALMEWPTSTPRGVFHILVAAAHGLIVAGVYVSPARWELRLGIMLNLAAPLLWLTGELLGVSPYDQFPLLAALAVAMIEITLSGLLAWPLKRRSR